MFDPFFALLFLAAVITPIVALVYWLHRKRSQSRMKGFILLTCAGAAILGFLCYAGSDLWVTNNGMVEFYVIVPEQKAEGFANRLAEMVGHFGMKAYVRHIPDFEGTPFHVLESHGNWLRLWSQNMPLDPDLPIQQCGRRLPVDPGQYTLMVFRVLPFGTKEAANEFASQMTAELRAAGYDVRSKPILCSPWLKNRIAH